MAGRDVFDKPGDRGDGFRVGMPGGNLLTDREFLERRRRVPKLCQSDLPRGVGAVGRFEDQLIVAVAEDAILFDADLQPVPVVGAVVGRPLLHQHLPVIDDRTVEAAEPE